MKFINKYFHFLTIGIIAILITSCEQKKTYNTNADAKKIYESHLIIVQNFIETMKKEGKVFGDTKNLNEAIIFLEKITKIEAEILNTYDYNFIPSMENYKDWKEWFELNSKTLFVENGTVKVKSKN